MSDDDVPTAKVVLLGDGGTGKTTFLQRFARREFDASYEPTMGVHVHRLTFQTSVGQPLRFDCWDTSGQERLGTQRDAYYRGADYAVLFFDVQSRLTYKNCPAWYRDVKRVEPDVEVLLVGNKIDVAVRQVKAKQITFQRHSSESSSSLASAMQEITPETQDLVKTPKSIESQGSCDDNTETRTNSEDGEQEDAVIRQTRTLLSRIDDFRQSYNRTHGQVCEFFERARVVQKLGLLDPTQAAQLSALSEDEANDDDCNSLADGNYADGQKTTGMKRKLRKWRKVMRSALLEICPELGLEAQPDINPGLMKHILDEVRNLKSQLAFQHNNILQLAHKTEMYRVDSEQKEQFIADLLQNCKGIRLDSLGQQGSKGGLGEGVPSFEGVNSKAPELPLPESVDEIQFGQSKQLITSLKLDQTEIPCSDPEQLVVDPIDFASAQSQLQRLVTQGGAQSCVPMKKAGESSGPSFLNAESAMRRRELLALDIQSRLPPPGFVPINPTAGTTSATTGPSTITSRPVAARDLPKRRNFFMNLGGSLTAALVAGIAVNSLQKRGPPQ